MEKRDYIASNTKRLRINFKYQTIILLKKEHNNGSEKKKKFNQLKYLSLKKSNLHYYKR